MPLLAHALQHQHHLGRHRPAPLLLAGLYLLRPALLLPARRHPARRGVAAEAAAPGRTVAARARPAVPGRAELHPAGVRDELRELGGCGAGVWGGGEEAREDVVAQVQFRVELGAGLLGGDCGCGDLLCGVLFGHVEAFELVGDAGVQGKGFPEPEVAITDGRPGYV